ncbi:response regulator [Candidatus Obscuribacterales bacterium]|nr:response regulator [Candidatus Obscuribacterales bacterium]
MSNEWNWHVNSLQTRLNDLQSTIDSIKSCVERRPGLDAATQAIAALIEASTQSEYALQEFPTALSQILSDPAIGSLLIGPQGEIVLYNATAEQLLGRDYLAERSMSSLQFSAEDRSTRLLADDLPWNRALKGESLPDVRLHLSRPTNPDTWINVSATPFRSPAGVITGAVVFIIDTTEEVQLEGSINTLCNTIHDQIAQVGSTHTQLRDLADRLSNVGIQRILSDGAPAPGRPEEDPTRKKSEPRRDAGVIPPAARQASLPQAAKNKNLVPPSPTSKSDSTLDSSAYGTEDLELGQSGTWAQVQEKVGLADAADLESANRVDVHIPEGSKTLEVERVEIEPEVTVAEPDEQFPTEQSIEKLQEVSLTDDQNTTSEFIDMSAHFNESELLSEDSGEVEAFSAAEVSAQEDDVAANASEEDAVALSEDNNVETETFDGWTSTPASAEEHVDASAGESDQVADSAKSLFGKFANLTKDSYSEAKFDDKEPDPALPWPELVDAPDYGEPLWDEYTQSEEEATPWQKDRVGEESAFALPPVEVNVASEETTHAVDEDVEEVYSDAESHEAQEIESEYAEPDHTEEPDVQNDVEHEYVQNEDTQDQFSGELPQDEPTLADEDAVFAAADLDMSVEEPYVVPGDEESVQESGEFEQAEHEVAAAFDEVDAEVAADDFSPVEPAAEAEEAIEVVIEEAPPASTATDTTDKQDALGTGNRLSALKDRKPRASASYNRLKPLSAAGELDEDEDGFLNEGLVKFSADELAPVEEGPKRVLVVDDIPVNQKLLLLHLKRLGYEADVASNGQEALDMLAEKAYELILMDCDMPVMSGFEAASRIRSNEAYSHRRIPIIALTSYDREGDKEKCIASGMDDYITKGASQKELKDTIERSIVSARMKDETLSTGESDDEADGAPLDITAMLKLYGREEVEEISRLFLSNMGTYIECMQLAIDNKDADSVAHFANAVKGPCAALGMRLMTRLTSDIIAYAESQDWTQVRVKYMRLKAVFVQTREELKKVCPDDSLLTT